MSKQQCLKSTNLTKIFISSENELWEWLDVNHASEQSFLLVTWKKNKYRKIRKSRCLVGRIISLWLD